MLNKILLSTLLLFALAFQGLSAQELSAYSRLFNVEFYEDDNRITKKEFKEKLMGYEDSAIYLKKSTTNEALFYGTYVVGLGGLVWLASESNQDDSDIAAPLVLGLGGFIASLIFADGASKNAAKAILTYNKQFDNRKTTYQLLPIGNRNGFGLALRF